MSDDKSQIQEVQRTPRRINAKIVLPRHILFKLQKIRDKAKILKETRGKIQLTYGGTKKNYIELRNHASKRKWSEKFKALREKNTTNLEFCTL